MMLPVPFSNSATYAGHSGVDFAQPRGTPFRASGSGRIGLRNRTARGGHIVWVDYDGYPGVAYAHLDDYTDSPPVGTPVVEGDVIGRVGNSGFSTGPHLHMEVYGHSTTAGFWRFFTASRVVGAGTPAGPVPGKPIETKGPVPGKPIETKGFLMALSDAEQSRLLKQTDAIYKALFGPNNGDEATTQSLGWRDVDGAVKKASYGLLDIAIDTRTQAIRAANKAT